MTTRPHHTCLGFMPESAARRARCLDCDWSVGDYSRHEDPNMGVEGYVWTPELAQAAADEHEANPGTDAEVAARCWDKANEIMRSDIDPKMDYYWGGYYTAIAERFS